MINKIYLTGNLGTVPDVRTTQDGREIANLSLATNSSWKNDQGEWQYRTDWYRIVVFREEIVQWAKKSLRRGDSLFVEGKLSYSESEDKLNENQKRKTACIVVSGREGHVHLLRSGKAHEKEKLSLCQDEDNLSLPFPDNQNANNIQGVPFLNGTSSKRKFKESPASADLPLRRVKDAELMHPTEDSIIPFKESSSHKTDSLTTGENPYENN